MNDYCRELNFSEDLYPKVDVSKYSTEGYTWATFHKILNPLELNNPYLIEYLNSIGLCCKFIEFFYSPPHTDGIIHCDNIDFTPYTKIYFYNFSLSRIASIKQVMPKPWKRLLHISSIMIGCHMTLTQFQIFATSPSNKPTWKGIRRSY